MEKGSVEEKKKKKISSSTTPAPQLKGVGPNPGDPEDVEAFLASLNPRHKTCPPWIARELIRLRATRCLTALLDRRISHNKLGPKVKLRDGRGERDPDEDKLYTMCYAAQHGFHDGLQLLAAYTRCWRRPGARGLDHAFEASLRDAAAAAAGTTTMTLSDSILWLPEWISRNFSWWHTVKLLCRQESGRVFRGKVLEYVHDGEALKLLWLLLAVPDLVLSPKFSDIDLYLRDLLAARLALLTADLQCRRARRVKDQQGVAICASHVKQIDRLNCSLLLLEVFERAGPQLSCLTATASKEKDMSTVTIREQVKAVLDEAGLPLTCLNRSIKIEESQPRERKKEDDSWELYYKIIKPATVCRSEVLDSKFNRVIEKLCRHPNLKEWKPQSSPFKLLYIFCLPDLVNKMQRMLPFEIEPDNPAKVINPDYLAELCFIYIKEGRIVEFTAALMAARVYLRLEHPLGPRPKSHYKMEPDPKPRPTVHDFLVHILKRVLDEEISLTGKSEDDDDSSVKMLKEKKMVLSAAILLTEVFENSAQHIHWYLHSTRYEDHRTDLKMIAEDVASLLKDSGFVLTSDDISVDDLDCFSSQSGDTKIGSDHESNSSSFQPHQQTVSCVKAGKDASGGRIPKSIMSSSTTTLESSPLGGSSTISKLSSTRSYHSFPILKRGGGSKADLVAKRMETATRSGHILRNRSWRFLAMTKNILMRL